MRRSTCSQTSSTLKGETVNNDEKRREIAGNLRYCAEMCNSTGVLDSDVLNALGIHCGDTDGVSSAYDVEKLADLIDRPTCRIIKSAKIYTAFGELIDTMNVYVLSCGHQAVGFNKPEYCPKCGTMVDR